VALSLALSPNVKDKGRYAEIPADEYPPIEQACVILGSSKNKETAQQFLSSVKSAAVADLLVGYGFDVRSRAAKQYSCALSSLVWRISAGRLQRGVE
jgi:molybdate transport system substrate-binding protein